MKISHSFMCFCRMDKSFSEDHQGLSFHTTISQIAAFLKGDVFTPCGGKTSAPSCEGAECVYLSE